MADGEDVITLPVPELVAAVYLVPTADPPDDPVSLLRQSPYDDWPPALRPMLDDLLAAASPPIEVRSIGEIPTPPLDLLAVMGATDEQLELVTSATHVIVISVHSVAGWPPV